MSVQFRAVVLCCSVALTNVNHIIVRTNINFYVLFE